MKQREEFAMLRKAIIGLVAGATLALGASAAVAEPHGGHFGGGHFGGPGISFGFGGPGFAVAPYAYDYDYGYGCYQTRRVWTPYGWRVRRVYVCD
jgi:uncharacterized membrane protein